MNSKRSCVAIGAALLAATFLVFSAVSAQGFSDHMKGKIPFAFYVADEQLPAGNYDVQTIASGVVKVYNSETHNVVLFNTVRLSNPVRDSSGAKLIFHRYGDDYFLSEMWWSGTQDGLKTIESKREHELARLSTPVRVSIVR
jgi:hypothetical protein